jgi:hypothetical protein
MMTTRCKKWFLPTDFWNPLCTNTFQPIAGQNGCHVCVTPVREQAACLSYCTPPLIAKRRILVNLSASLSDPGYSYPHLVTKPGTDYLLYDMMPSGSQIAQPCLIEATGWSAGVNTTCVWEGSVITRRWYRKKRESNGTLSMEVVDSPYGEQIENPFDDCGESGAYPWYYCRYQDWGFQWRLEITGAAAILRLYRLVARHALADSLPQGPILPNAGDGGDILVPYYFPLHAAILPGSGSGVIWYPHHNGEIARWMALSPCEISGQWVLSKTVDVSEYSPVPGGMDPLFNTYPARNWISPVGFPDTVRLDVRF